MKRRLPLLTFIAVGLTVALALAFFVSPRASNLPDGLERVAADHSLDTGRRASPTDDGPLAGYSTRGVHDQGLSTGTAGVVGTVVVFGIAFGLARVVRRRNPVTGPGRRSS